MEGTAAQLIPGFARNLAVNFAGSHRVTGKICGLGTTTV
jgi:hypothetical protein